MKDGFIVIGKILRGIWKVLTTGSRVITNLLFLAVLIVFLSYFIEPEIEVPDGAALVLAPAGELVEKKTVIDPLSRFINGFAGIPLPEETLLQDVLDVIKRASEDERIRMIVLNLDELEQAGLNQLQTLGESLEDFRKSGKKIVAIGDQFSQGHYYLATFADEIYLDPMGSVNLLGFGVYRLYLKELMDRLAINFHIFKVGAFKSALEPFSRTSMSPEAREANQDWLTRIWEIFCSDIARNRDFAPEFITDFINNMSSFMERAGGNSAEMAVEANLIDGVMTRPEIRAYLISQVGIDEAGDTFRQIHFVDYLKTISPTFGTKVLNTNNIGVIVARGNIVYGDMVPGQISSQELSKMIRQAREDEAIKAVVLRIDSGGGSAFASEQIRQELLLLKQAGKPLVVSMGALAASGAYWLAADADHIFASPFTLTGSIGIFGMIPTFEDSIAKIGLNSDGIGTTDMASATNLAEPLPPELKKTIQLGIEDGYRKFLTIVAEGRNMDLQKVRMIAEGRVWDGTKAMELGLVDELGGLAESVETAADMANLQEYKPVYLRPEISPGSSLLEHLNWRGQHSLASLLENLSGNRGILPTLNGNLSSLTLGRDPANLYTHSLLFSGLLTF